MKRKGILSILVTIAVLVGLLVPTAVTMATSTETMTISSEAGVDAYGPLTSYAPLGDGAWGSSFPAVVAWVHPSWPTISGATWISTSYFTEPPYTSNSWRWFHDEFMIPEYATNILATAVVATADNAEDFYLNDVLVGSNSNWATITSYPITPIAGLNKLDFIVRNAPGSDSPTANPTGLIYKVEVTYDVPDLDTLSPDDVYNPVGSSHTVCATLDQQIAGVPIEFEVTGVNGGLSAVVNTDDKGQAQFEYMGINSGEDTITATFDDVTLTVHKYWIENWVTGGGNIKIKGKPDYIVSGNVGVVEGVGIVGQIQIHDNISGNAYHLDTFSYLAFSGDEATSPAASNNKADFVGSDGSTEVHIIIEDLGEPGAGVDTLKIDIGNDSTWESEGYDTQITSGNFQIHGGMSPVAYQMIECPYNYPTGDAPGVVLCKFTNPSSGVLRTKLYMEYVLPVQQYDVYLGVDAWIGSGGIIGSPTTDLNGNWDGQFDWSVTPGDHRLNLDIVLHGSGSDIYEFPEIHGSPSNWLLFTVN